MSIFEVKMWKVRCDMCLKEGPTIISQNKPDIPSTWSSKRIHDCGMTGYSTTRIYCQECTRKDTQRDTRPR